MRGRADRKMLDEWVVEGRGGEVRGAFLFRPVSHQFERSQTKLFVSASDDREKKALRVSVVVFPTSPPFRALDVKRAEEFGMDFVRPKTERRRYACCVRTARSTCPRFNFCLGEEKQQAARVGRAVSWLAGWLSRWIDWPPIGNLASHVSFFLPSFHLPC